MKARSSVATFEDYMAIHSPLVRTTSLFVGILLIIKGIVIWQKWEVVSANPFLTAIIGGITFTLTIMYAGILADFKESEKIPGELAGTINGLYTDLGIIGEGNAKHKSLTSSMQRELYYLLRAMNRNFSYNLWNLRDIHQLLGNINFAVGKLVKAQLPPQFTVRLRSELSSIEKMCLRIATIVHTEFLPAAFFVVQGLVGASLLILLFVSVDSPLESLAFFGVISFLFIGLILLMKDMDNPFEVTKNASADVDLAPLRQLENHLEAQLAKQK